MAYNYSPWFLVQNKDTVDWLTRLAKDSDVGHRIFHDWHQAKTWREQILAILACLVYNEPDKAWVKNALRTWIDRGPDGTIKVCVGHPSKAGRRLRGPKPVAIQPGTIQSAEVYEIAAIQDQGDLMKVQLLLTKAGEMYKEVLILEPPPPAGIEYFRALRSPEGHFEILTTEPHLRLRIVHSSATDALPVPQGSTRSPEASP